MWRTNFKMAWRHIRRARIYSFINIAGLGIGIACSLTIALYIQDEYSYDRFHQYHREIYRVAETQDHKGVLHPVAVTPGLLAEALKRDYPEIVQACRVSRPLPGILTLNGLSIEPSQIITADHSFFTMFDFRLLTGNPGKVLLEPNEVVIAEKIAVQLFGAGWKNNPALLGQQLILNNNGLFTLAGVTPDCPANSHIRFDVILSMRYEEIRKPENFSHWGNHAYHTYLQLDAQANPVALGGKLKDYLLPFNTWSNPTLWLQPLDEIYLHSHFDYGDWVKTGSIVYLRIFLAVGIAVLLIALFNFINLSTARATERAREVGVRKVIGAVRRQLMVQFLCESFLTTALSVLLSVFLLFVFVPILNDISGKAITISFNAVSVLVILGATVLVSSLAGVYPAFLLSSFQPVKTLKGLFSTGTGQLFRRTLVVAQFIFSVMLILGTIVVYAQLKFIQEKDMGFNREQLIFLRLKNQLFNKAALLKSDLQRETSILGVTAASNNLIDVNASTHSIAWEGQDTDVVFPMSHMIVDTDFLSTTGITLLSGRNFDATLSSDSASWLINETAAKRMGWITQEAVGKSLRLWNTQGTVVGVVKDFHFRPMTTAIEPMLFRYWPGDPMNFGGLFIRTRQGQTAEAIGAVERLYRKHESQTIPDYAFLDQKLDNIYRTEQNTGRIAFYFSILAILVSCLGLFGLTTFSSMQRTREIGIRKILGASVPNVVAMLSKDFMSLVGIAILIALPLGWWAMVRWLGAFAYHVDVTWWMILFTAGTITAVAFITTSFQAIRAAITNPVDSLRNE
ncbi:MAG: ABC transporter permease [Cyclobacteriaceae bacterium]|nr:ABC transporter permease [Cyclobacteriaceae bacterium]